MNPINDLIKEHGPIKLMLRILEKVCGRLESGEALDKNNMEQAIIFIREFADKCHHGKEEALLFPAIRKNQIPEEIEMAHLLTEEHEIGRGFVKGMAEANDISDSSKFIVNARNYIKLLDHHIDQENQVLFPMVLKSLSPDTLKELETGFENVEKNIIGEGRHEELHDIIHQLKKINRI